MKDQAVKKAIGYNAPVVSSEINGSEQPSFMYHPNCDRGFFHIFSPLDYIEAIQRGGTRQSILSRLVQALTYGCQPCDLILSSAGVDARRSGATKVGRDFLQLSSQIN